MPRAWYDYHANSLGDGCTQEDLEKRQLYLSILADKKPYFMRYIYPDLMKQYNTYLKNTNAKCNMLFKMTVEELQALPHEELTDDQRQFLAYYDSRMPVSMADSVMNRICRRIEQKLSAELKADIHSASFDPALLRSDAEYSSRQYYAVNQLYKQYKKACAELTARQVCTLLDEERYRAAQESIRMQFTQDCMALCSNAQQLCSILVDMCYGKATSKRFVWDICADELLRNLYNAGGRKLTFPTPDPDGDLEFHGRRYTMITKEAAV